MMTEEENKLNSVRLLDLDPYIELKLALINLVRKNADGFLDGEEFPDPTDEDHRIFFELISELTRSKIYEKPGREVLERWYIDTDWRKSWIDDQARNHVGWRATDEGRMRTLATMAVDVLTSVIYRDYDVGPLNR